MKLPEFVGLQRVPQQTWKTSFSGSFHLAFATFRKSTLIAKLGRFSYRLIGGSSWRNDERVVFMPSAAVIQARAGNDFP